MYSDDLRYTIEYIERHMVGIVYKHQLRDMIRECIKHELGMEYINKCLDLWKSSKEVVENDSKCDKI